MTWRATGSGGVQGLVIVVHGVAMSRTCARRACVLLVRTMSGSELAVQASTWYDACLSGTEGILWKCSYNGELLQVGCWKGPAGE